MKILISVFCASLILSACKSVPITGRRQVNVISESKEKRMGDQAYQEILKKTPPLPDSDPRVQKVRKIGDRLAAVANKPDFKWEFNVIAEDKTINAFCLPGGKVAVYTGILPVASNDDQLATVMGHEIGHAIAHHGAERMSQGVLAQVGGAVLAAAVGGKSAQTQEAYNRAYNTGAVVGVMLPFSRKHETEADHIGLVFMAKAGYNPAAAADFWKNMAKMSEGKKKPDQFLSTHPSDEKRIKDIEGWLPEVQKYYQESPYRGK